MLNRYILPFLARGFKNENAISALISLGASSKPQGFDSKEIGIHNCLAVNPFLSTAQIDQLYETSGSVTKTLLASRLDLNEEQIFKILSTRDPILRQAVLTKPILWSCRNRFSDSLASRIVAECHLNTLETNLLLDLMSNKHVNRDHLARNGDLLRVHPMRIDEAARVEFKNSRDTLSIIKSENRFEEYLTAPWPDQSSRLVIKVPTTDYTPLEMSTVRFTFFSKAIGWPNQSTITCYQIEGVVGDASEEFFTVLFELLIGWDAPGTLLEALEVALSIVPSPVKI